MAWLDYNDYTFLDPALEDVEDFINYDLTHDDDTSDEDFEIKTGKTVKTVTSKPKTTKIKEEVDDEDEEDVTKEYQCYYCGQMIISLKNVKEHMRDKHRRFHR